MRRPQDLIASPAVCQKKTPGASTDTREGRYAPVRNT